MYSILIQNQKTMRIFQEYASLFTELFQTKKMGCCRWVESGNTIDTALPGLRELIEDKGEWRAIVVQVEEEAEKKEFESTVANPYDFFFYQSSDNGEKTLPVEESPIPLVRLSQMLGGVPAPELRFKEDWIKQEGKVPQRIYRPEKNAEDDKMYQELVHRYDFDGSAPSDVILVTLRGSAPKSIREDTKVKWDFQKEEQTQAFCRRNRYASICRFIKYDYAREGRVRKDADYFNFWTCVMLLARETFDPSSLQAYRLYNIKAEFSKEDLTEIFQAKTDQLIGCRAYVQREIRLDMEHRLNDKHPAPGYYVNIPVSADLPNTLVYGVTKSDFQFCPKSIAGETKHWEGLQGMAEEEVRRFYVASEKALDESAERTRFISSYPEAQVLPVDKYEKREMVEGLSRIFDDILETQNKLSAIKSSPDDTLKKAGDNVRAAIKERIPGMVVIEVGLGLFMGIVLCCLPALMFMYQYLTGTWEGVLYYFAMMLLFFLAVLLIFLLRGKLRLNKRIEEYNDTLEDNVAVLTRNVGFFSQFISDIVSHQRGKSYLNTLECRKLQVESDADILQDHLLSIDRMISNLQKWSKALFLPVSFERNLDKEYGMDCTIMPENNSLYTFEVGKDYEIPLNNSGNFIHTPFIFVKRLCLEREELFEDERGTD